MKKRLLFVAACLLVGLALGVSRIADADCGVPATLVELELVSITVDGVDEDLSTGPTDTDFVQPLMPTWGPATLRVGSRRVTVE